MNTRNFVQQLVLAATLIFFSSLNAGALPQRTYPTAEAAVRALVAAVRSNGVTTLQAVLGPGSHDLVCSGDAVADRASRRKFLSVVHQRCDVVEVTPDRCLLVLGRHRWVFPIPLVRKPLGPSHTLSWVFDTPTGRQEILNRRIGYNELTTIGVCRTYVDAQYHYARGRNGEYASRLGSRQSATDGLYWPQRKGQPQSPLGPLLAAAEVPSTAPSTSCLPYHGYYFRILQQQGDAAPGGAVDYRKDGHMTKGFALVAWPARYGVSGVMTFMVNHNGIVYEKDLGAKTSTLVSNLTTFNPDTSWRPVDER